MSPSAYPISGILIREVRDFYDRACQRPQSDYAEEAISAYILTTTAVEAFVNENFFNDVKRVILQKKKPEDFPSEEHIQNLERKPLLTKIKKLTKNFCNKTMDKNKQPLKDMNLLYELRKELVHYKMNIHQPPDIVIALTKKGIAFNHNALSWVQRVCTLEGIK